MLHVYICTLENDQVDAPTILDKTQWLVKVQVCTCVFMVLAYVSYKRRPVVKLEYHSSGTAHLCFLILFFIFISSFIGIWYSLIDWVSSKSQEFACLCLPNIWITSIDLHA